MSGRQAIRIATRGSMLAMAQARIVSEAIRSCRPGAAVELAPIVTRGDRTAAALAPIGAKGLFTAELESALRSGDVLLAVHSAKDLPARMAEDLTIAAVPARADPRDALVWRDGGPVESLPAGAAVGTSSLRRRAQLLALRPDLKVVPIRGNVETRLGKALEPNSEGLLAVVLAMAGLERSGLARTHARHIHPLPVADVVPAAGQGALAVQSLASSSLALELAARIEQPTARAALEAERQVVGGLGAHCRSCLAVHVAPCSAGGQRAWRALAMAARADGRGLLRFDLMAAAPGEAAAALLAAMEEKRVPELIKA